MKQQEFPVTVTEQGVSAKIRKITQTKKGKSYTVYIADFIQLGKRKQIGRASFEEAEQVARDACRKTANGTHSALELPLADRLSFIRATEILAPTRVPIDIACRDYADALQILGGKASLAEACREWVKRNSVALPQITIIDAAKKFNAESETEKSLLRRKALAWTTRHLERAFGTVRVETITPDQISRHLAGLALAERTKKNHRDSIGFFNRWLILRGYLAKGTDWLEHVQDYSKAKTGEIEIYTPVEVSKLLSTANGMTAFIAIGAFAGLRHAEIARLDWSAIDLKDGWITVQKTIAKTGVRRLVPIKDNLKKWLSPVVKQSGPVVPYENTTKQLLKVAGEAGVTWKHNALRHSYISFRLAECADIGRVADEAGNSAEVIRTNYLRRVKPDQGDEWFSIVPAPETVETKN